MQDELLQFRLQKVWRLVDLPKGKHAFRIKRVYRNKKDERRIVVRNKARLVAQGYTQEEGIDYDEVFSLVARIEAIRLFLAYASYMGFIVYQMDVKSTFLYGIIEEEVYVCQPPSFEDPHFPNKVYKVEKALYGLHQASRAWINAQELSDEFCGELTFFLGLQVMQKDNGIFISQDKYVADILKKFDFSSVKTASTPIETNKALLKDEEAEDFDGALEPIASTRWLVTVEGEFHTSNYKEKNKVKFASNFLHDSAKIWWEGKVCEKGEEWIGACTWKEFKELFNVEFTLAKETDKIQEEFQTLMQTDETVNEMWKKFNDLICIVPSIMEMKSSRSRLREADLLRKKNKEAKETKRKIKFGDRDTKKPKHDQGRKSRGTQIKTPFKKCHKTHLGTKE
nr:hypothetical protein [Tanacetum cinerariifolium]